jgi:hypothetical protein
MRKPGYHPERELLVVAPAARSRRSPSPGWTS